MSDTSFTLGEHEAKIEALASDVTDIKRIVVDIKKTQDEQRGEQRAAKYFAGAAGGIIGTLLTGAVEYFRR